MFHLFHFVVKINVRLVNVGFVGWRHVMSCCCGLCQVVWKSGDDEMVERSLA